MDYLLHIAIVGSVFTILSLSLDLLAGRTGLVSMAQAAFYGLGAYTSALLTTRLAMPFLAGVFGGVLIAILFSFVVSLPSLRLRNDYFAIATFSFQMILFSIFNNWMDLTHGPLGIPGIPQPTIFNWQINTHVAFLTLVSAFAAFTFVVVYLLTSSPFGRVLHAIREDEIFAQSLGKNPLYFKVTAFAVSAALAAMAGSLYAHYITYIDPTSFSVMESILVISMVVIGGAGSTWGPLVGAVVLVMLPEALRFIGLPSSVAANLRQILYGALLIVMMMWRPKGLVGNYGFGR